MWGRFLVNINQKSSNQIVFQALEGLKCMEHRGACGADGISGDGSGVTTQIPWSLLDDYFKESILSVPRQGLGLAMVFLPNDFVKEIHKVFQWVAEQNGFKIIGWRPVPIDKNVLGMQALANQPVIHQCLVSSDSLTDDNLERQLYILRKKIEKNISQTNLNLNKQFYICSFSSRIVVYKGMVKSEVLGQFYKDLYNPRYFSNFAIYHRRFSTNTMPKWSLAQPMRFIAHNGEINTLLGNLNWMRSKEPMLSHQYWNNCIEDLKPITNLENSDSSNLDAALELLIASGRSPQESLMILIPEAYENQPSLEKFPEIVDFYEYYASLQEPWDGPALVVFTDGKIVGATLDRNGLRPARYCITNTGLVMVSSEAGAVEIAAETILQKGRLGPGQMFCVDMVNQIVLDNWTIKQSIANKFPYKKWIHQYQQILPTQPYLDDLSVHSTEMVKLHTAFGYTSEDVELVIEHMASLAKEPTFCMGDDTPLAVLSQKPHLLYNYFKQRFAQVTNPAIDPLRESLVMSLAVYIGSKGNILRPSDYMARSIKLKSPVVNENELLQLSSSGYKVAKISTFFNQDNNQLLQKINQICDQCLDFVNNGVEILILSDKKMFYYQIRFLYRHYFLLVQYIII